MSNLSGNSSESTSVWPKGKITGVPRRCWCGDQVVIKLSKTDGNHYRRYFRCAHASSNRLKDDNHVFKWVNEAILNEIDVMDAKIATLTQQLTISRLENERLQREIKIGLFERVESVVMDAKCWFKKFVCVMGLGFIIGCIGFKFFG